MDQVELDAIIARIEGSFGSSPPFSGRGLEESDLAMLERVFGDSGFQRYLQDQVNRQIITDYLTNATVLGYISTRELERIGRHAGTPESRSWLALHMLMNSVEDAARLPLERPDLQKLGGSGGDDDSDSHLRLVSS